MMTFVKLWKRKNRLYKSYFKNRTQYRKSAYKRVRNKVADMIKHAKKEYYRNQLNKAKGNMSQTWNVINTALGKDNKKTNINKIVVENKHVTDEKAIPILFNDHFVDIGYNLNSKFIARNNNHVGKYIIKNIKSAFFLRISSDEIVKVVKDLKSNASPGYDDIDIKAVKKIIIHICQPLSAIFNKMLRLWYFSR